MKLYRSAAIAATFALALGACASTDDPIAEESVSPAPAPAPTATDAEADGAFPFTIEADNGPVTIDARPEAIISMSAATTEILFAIDAGAQVLAVDTTSNFPPEAPMSELSAFTPNVEAIAAMNPDLVIVSFDPGDLVSGLEAVGIPTIVHFAANSLEDSYRQIEQLGAATGNIAEAANLVGEITTELSAIESEMAGMGDSLTYFHELGAELYTATSSTFIGEIYGLFGLVNIADTAADAAGGYPQLSAEFIVEADPDLIFLADTKCCAVDIATVGARDGWGNMTAVKNGNVIELDDDIASRWGPRVVDYARAVRDAILAVDREAVS